MRLCTDFVRHLDARRHDAVVELFTPDGRLDRLGTVFEGRERIADFLAARPATLVTRHLCTNLHVAVLETNGHVASRELQEVKETQEAEGSCDVLFFQAMASDDESADPPAALGPPSIVEYVDRYRRTPAGWRIHERRIRMAMRGSA